MFQGCALVVTGHIHHAQFLEPNIVGAGSLYRCSFAEAQSEKSYVLVSVEDGAVRWERRAVPCREQSVITVHWKESQDETMTWRFQTKDLILEAGRYKPMEEMLAGREVKLVVEIPEDQLSTFDPSVFDPIKEVAALFVLEKRTLPLTRTRAPEIAGAHSLTEQLRAWGEAVGETVRESVVEKIGELEES
jgi:hypothetical protein